MCHFRRAAEFLDRNGDRERTRRSDFVPIQISFFQKPFFSHFLLRFSSLIRYLPKHAADFFHGLVLRLRHFLVYEEREEQL